MNFLIMILSVKIKILKEKNESVNSFPADEVNLKLFIKSLFLSIK